MNVITIVLADDHKLVREGLRALLQHESDFQVVGEAGDGLEALRLVQQLRPSVLVLDLMLPGLRGLEVTRQLTQRGFPTKVVILSMHSDEAYVQEARRHGASAFIVKDAGATELARGVREAVAGRNYLSPPLSEPALAAYAEKVRASSASDPYETLTNREREVLQLTAEGHANPEVAARLFLSPRTVETHRASLMRKLGLHTQTDLIHYALQHGVLPPDATVKLAKE